MISGVLLVEVGICVRTAGRQVLSVSFVEVLVWVGVVSVVAARCGNGAGSDSVGYNSWVSRGCRRGRVVLVVVLLLLLLTVSCCSC